MKDALVELAERVEAFFAQFATAGAYLAAAVTGAGTSPLTWSGEPASDYDVRVEFVVGGTVGTPGIKYIESLDAGRTNSVPKDLGEATTIAVMNTASAVVLNLGAGTVLTGEVATVTTEGPRKTATVDVGWIEQAKQINQGPRGANRVVFQPGDDSGKDGPIVAPQRQGPRVVTAPPGISTRSLWDEQRLTIVSVWAVDPARPHHARASLNAVAKLQEDVMQAVQAIAAGNATWGAPAWTKPLEQQFGKERRLPLTFRATVFDLPTGTATPSPAVARDPSA